MPKKITTCSLCWKKNTKTTIKGNEELAMALCPDCLKEVERAEANKDIPISEIKLKNPQKLCVQCGLCCFMLDISIPKAEADRLCEKTGVAPSVVYKEVYPNNESTNNETREISLPCHFLTGRPLQWVLCRAYGKHGRPEICKVYLCKIGIEYSLGVITEKMALFTLRSILPSGNIGIFNWGAKAMEDRHLQLSYELARGFEKLRETGVPENVVKYKAAESVTRKWFFRNSEDHALFSMHMEQAFRGNFSPKMYVPHLHLSTYSPEETAFASKIIGFVMEMILDYVEPASQALLDEINEEAEIANLIRDKKGLSKGKSNDDLGFAKSKRVVLSKDAQEDGDPLIKRYEVLSNELMQLKREYALFQERYEMMGNESLIATQKMRAAEQTMDLLEDKIRKQDKELLRVVAERNAYKDHAKALNEQLMEWTGNSESPDNHIELNKEKDDG